MGAGWSQSWPRSPSRCSAPSVRSSTSKAGESWKSLGLTGNETISIVPDADLTPQSEAQLLVTRADGTQTRHTLLLRIDTPVEVDYYRAGGILPFVLRQLLGPQPVSLPK